MISLHPVELEKALIQNGIGAIDLFFAAKIGGASKGDIRRLIQQGGAAINAKTFDDVKRVVGEADLDKDGELVLRAGKKKFVRVVFK